MIPCLNMTAWNPRRLQSKLVSFRTAAAELSKTFSDDRAFNPADSRLSLTIAGIDYDLATLASPLSSHGPRDARSSRLKPSICPRMRRSKALKGHVSIWCWARCRRVPRAWTKRSTDRTLPRGIRHCRARSLTTFNMRRCGYAQASHLLVLPSGIGRGVIDQFLAEHGLERNVRSTVPMFFPALMILGNPI